MKNHQFAREIIRAYDIRGIFGENLNKVDAYYIAIKLATLRRNRDGHGIIVIGYDGRISSPALHQSLLDGFRYSEAKIFDLGLVPTPLLYFAAHFLDNVDIAVMITGSHNPSEYNGFKIIVNGEVIHNDDLKALADLEVSGVKASSNKLINIDLTREYLACLSKDIEPLNIVWDPGNGAACDILRLLIQQLPGNHHIINGEIDGYFPSHLPDPSKKQNLEQLITSVLEGGYDLGIAFDGDADRLGVVTKEGRVLFGSHLLLIFAYDLLQRKPGARIITDSKMSNVVIERIRQWSGEPIRYKTGHALIKAEMKKTHALLAGEVSGHLFFAEDYYGFDDAIFGACRFLKIISHYPSLIQDILQIIDSVISTEDIIIKCNEAEKAIFMEAVKRFLDENSIVCSEVDGIRVEKDSGWFLIRASNTEDVITAIAEANNHNELQKMTDIMKNALDKGYKSINRS